MARAAGVTVSLDINYRGALWPPDEAGAWLRETIGEVDVLFATEPEGRLITSPSGGRADRRRRGGGRTDRADARTVAAGRSLPSWRGRWVRSGRGMCWSSWAPGRDRVVRRTLLRAEPHQVTEVDPVGAGDGFAAGWLTDWLAGATPERRLRDGVRGGAFAVTSQGDWESLPGATTCAC